MTEIIEASDGTKVLVIAEQPPETCDICGTEAECRPYGPNGENVCFPCGTGTPEAKAAAERAFRARMDEALS